MVTAAVFVAIFGACLAGVAGFDGVFGFVRQWAKWTVILSALAGVGLMLGQIMRGVLCSGPWVCE